jgi:hypothetical protein
VDVDASERRPDGERRRGHPTRNRRRCCRADAGAERATRGRVMQKRPELYVISEPEAPAAADLIAIGANAAASPPPRERSWRDLMARLQKSRAPHKPLA